MESVRARRSGRSARRWGGALARRLDRVFTHARAPTCGRAKSAEGGAAALRIYERPAKAQGWVGPRGASPVTPSAQPSAVTASAPQRAVGGGRRGARAFVVRTLVLCALVRRYCGADFDRTTAPASRERASERTKNGKNRRFSLTFARKEGRGSLGATPELPTISPKPQHSLPPRPSAPPGAPGRVTPVRTAPKPWRDFQDLRFPSVRLSSVDGTSRTPPAQ